ncbi:BnaA01g25200D [Brassica napus]|uniref:BnaA01g25200D protein n=1 Tax=Brassica napus TaxID=3708 RepID=A0A078HG08_BRANA|nr:BnaA01g25200D [Brassica napus]
MNLLSHFFKEPSRLSLSSITCVVKRGHPEGDANGNSFDHTTKLLHLAWHPTENSIACLRPTVCTCTMLEEKRKHPQIEKEALATCETE